MQAIGQSLRVVVWGSPLGGIAIDLDGRFLNKVLDSSDPVDVRPK